MRRLRMGLFLYVVASMVVLAGSVASAGVTNAQILQSGALGLTRDQFETLWGPATQSVDLPGQPDSDEMLLYSGGDTVTTVTYREINGDQLAINVEHAWLGDGVSQSIATDSIEQMLPVDAVVTELYIAPSTPNGPAALTIYRYTSESLAGAWDGVLAPEILVIKQHAWNDAAGSSTITSISLMIRERTQLTG